MRLEHTEGSSRKFWEATLEGRVLRVRWGRLGADGQHKDHVFPDDAAACAERDKLVREKLRKGYILVADEPIAATAPGTPPPSPPIDPPPSPAPREHAPSRPSTAEARARAATLAPSKRSDSGVLTWSLFRDVDGAREFFEVSVAGREMEIARGKVGKQGRVREITLDPGEPVEARVVRELGRALAEGFVPGDEEAPTPDIVTPEEARRRRAAAWLRRHARTGWVPAVEDGEGPLDGSRFGGLPALRRDELAPRCGLCEEPLTLIAQIASASLPAKAREVLPSGLIQLFWCDTACQSKHGWAPFSPANLARALPATGPLRHPDADETPERAFAPKRVTGWFAIETYPRSSDRPAVDGDDDLADVIEELCDEEGEGYSNRGGERLLGWAHWIQDVEVVHCRACSARMVPALQVDTNTTLHGLAFGDSGIGFMMLCPACKEMTFVWQSC